VQAQRFEVLPTVNAAGPQGLDVIADEAAHPSGVPLAHVAERAHGIAPGRLPVRDPAVDYVDTAYRHVAVQDYGGVELKG
jgi:hypothetical protein